MKNRSFVITLILITGALIGWYIYVSAQANQARSVQEVSVDWWGSAHADLTAEAFTHWNEDDPAEVPVSCAKCHSGAGFIDYIGQDGSAAMSVDAPAAVNSVITCEVCHSEQADALTSASLPSGIQASVGSGNALCATCHSGTNSGAAVSAAEAGFGADEVMADIGFVNPHYAFAAATWLGADGEGGFQYDGRAYAGQFEHATGVQSCTQCHDPHSLHMRADYESESANLCATCHSNVTGYKDYREVYVDGIDYDGDGQVEGLYHEIEGMREVLYRAMQAYSAETSQPILWADQNPNRHVDTNQDGEAGEDEVQFANGFSGFTPRLMRAAFNFQFSAKDPAGYVHNGRYVLQLLYDSIADLAGVVDVDMSALVRPD